MIAFAHVALGQSEGRTIESHTGESEMIPLEEVGEGVHQAELGVIVVEQNGA